MQNNDGIYTPEFLHNQEVHSRFLDMVRIMDVQPRDYGDGNLLSKTEMLILMEIERKPGISAAELCNIFDFSKGTASQILTRLEKCGYVERAMKQSNRKTKHLYITADGRRVCRKRASIRMEQHAELYKWLCALATPGEMASFYKVLGLYGSQMEGEIERRRHMTDSDTPRD